jgi:hypothetical protein
MCGLSSESSCRSLNSNKCLDLTESSFFESERRSLDEPVYAQVANASLLNERSPEVRRTELIAVRRSDQKVVARWVEFSRVGGDPPTGLTHESSFHCPDPLQVIAELQPLFLTPE